MSTGPGAFMAESKADGNQVVEPEGNSRLVLFLFRLESALAGSGWI